MTITLHASLPDTGRRRLNLTKDTTAAVYAHTALDGDVYLQRVGSTVFCSLQNLMTSSANLGLGVFPAVTIPVGFQPASQVNTAVLYGEAVSLLRVYIAASGSLIRLTGTGRTGTLINGSFSWVSSQAFPLPYAYPGTAVP